MGTDRGLAELTQMCCCKPKRLRSSPKATAAQRPMIPPPTMCKVGLQSAAGIADKAARRGTAPFEPRGPADATPATREGWRFIRFPLMALTYLDTEMFSQAPPTYPTRLAGYAWSARGLTDRPRDLLPDIVMAAGRIFWGHR